MADTITIRMTAGERAAVEAAAGLAGLTVSEFCRRHRRRWDGGRVVKCEKSQIITPRARRDEYLCLSGVAPAADLMEWREALVRDARGIQARFRPLPETGLEEGVDYIVEEGRA